MESDLYSAIGLKNHFASISLTCRDKLARLRMERTDFEILVLKGCDLMTR
ncbi:MAG: hypothetical protein Q7K57_25315 [Burkholderiaceae bacterium]|nr:hypothetical protein [Burkholderiaceae bacterium]